MNDITISTPTAEIVIRPKEPALAVLAVDGYASLPQTGGFTKVLADGAELPADSARTDHVAVIDHRTGLMWSVESLGSTEDADDGIGQEACEKRCSDLRLLGHADWRLPTRSELAALVDDTRHEPAIDTALFPRVKSRWHWTSTPCAWSSASAWLVLFNGGSVHRSPTPAAATGSRWPCVVPVSNWPF